ncbi:MAG TPA: response regulator, partial [Catenuloplanes sp.]
AEDEDGIRETLTRTLSAAGYTVLAAASGAEALDLADRHVGAIQLLLSDVMMPGMLGDELAAGLLRRRPDTTVLFMSGHVGDLIDRYGLLDPALTVLSKPFTKAQVLLAIRAALGAPRR